MLLVIMRMDWSGKYLSKEIEALEDSWDARGSLRLQHLPDARPWVVGFGLSDYRRSWGNFDSGLDSLRISTYFGDPSVSFGVPAWQTLGTSTKSELSIHYARAWMHGCVGQVAESTVALTESVRGDLRPSCLVKLVDAHGADALQLVDTMRLIGKYATLSYCWATA
jgi:hypothetical protein